jgi:SSS family solute:Na+ symporter
MGKAAEAKKAAVLSAFMYLLYPLFLYIPVWSAPVLVGAVQDAEMAYIVVAQQYLPQIAPGLLGLLVAGMFAATMSMVNSDISALAAVFCKDIYQRTMDPKAPESRLLKVGYMATVVFGVLTVLAAFETERYADAFGVMMDWYAAILGPVSIPLLLGMLVRRTTWRGAFGAWLGGFVTFVLFKYWLTDAIALSLFGGPPSEAFAWTLNTGAELIVAFGIFFLEGYVNHHTPEEQQRVDAMFSRIAPRPGEVDQQAAEAEASVASAETGDNGLA